MTEKTVEQKQMAQGGVAGCLACSTDALNKAAEIVDRLGNNKKLRYEIGRAKDKVADLLPLIEKMTE